MGHSVDGVQTEAKRLNCGFDTRMKEIVEKFCDVFNICILVYLLEDVLCDSIAGGHHGNPTVRLGLLANIS